MKWLFLIAVTIQQTVSCIAPGSYIGIHQSYGVLAENFLGKTHQISEGHSGLSGKDPLGVWIFHYQYPKTWSITTIMSSQFSPYNTKNIDYHACIGSVVVKRELFKSQRLHVYFPMGGWGALSEAVPKTDSNQITHNVYGVGVVFGGLGYQIDFNTVLVDISYNCLWSLYRMNHTRVWTISLALRIA